MRFLRLVWRNMTRSRTRTILTFTGIAVSMFIFAALLGLDGGVRRMLSATSGEDVIIVFERYKACPPYSNLPVHYADEISQMPHVKTVMPVKFLLSNCGTTTDLVALHGIEPGVFRDLRDIQISSEQYSEFSDERGAAIVGRTLADRYGWQPGQQVTLPQLRGISFTVRGVFDAPGSSLEQVVLVDREYLEYSISDVGSVTMFMVKVDDPASLDATAALIDQTFTNHSASTKSGPEKGFIAAQIRAFSDLVGFAQLIAYMALVLLMAAVANSVSMSVRDRLREMALLKLVGFDSSRVSDLILLETGLLGTLATTFGVGAATAIFQSGGITISVEGFTMVPYLAVDITVIALIGGVILTLFGAWLAVSGAANRPIVSALKGVD